MKTYYLLILIISITLEAGVLSAQSTFTDTLSLETQTIAPSEQKLITPLGIERPQGSLSYAAQPMQTETFSQARELNTINSLSGRVAGISVLRSGSGVGSPSRVTLRGNRSFTANNQPLYVVDGMPILGETSTLNPDDIASITVLRGANAAALYGNRAQNGAILITTKTGSDAYRVSLSSTFIADFPHLLQEYQNIYGQGAVGEYNPHGVQAWGPEMEGQEVQHWSSDPSFADSTYTFSPHNAVRDFFQGGQQWSNHLSISGSTEKTQSYFSYTFTDAKGVVPTNELRRHNVHLRVKNQFHDRLKLDAKLNYLREDANNRLAEGAAYRNPNPVRYAYLIPPNIRTQDIAQFEYTDVEGNIRQHFWNPCGCGLDSNPYWTINRTRNLHVTDRMLAMASLQYRLTDRLSVQLRSGLDRWNHAWERKYHNDTYIIADGGLFALDREETYEWNSDFLLTYESKIGKSWDLDVFAGGNARRYRGTQLHAGTDETSWGLIVPNLFSLNNSQYLNARNTPHASKAVHSLYGSAQLGWKKALYLNLTARNDWSSALPKGHWSYFYPSVGLNGILTELLDLPAFVSFATLRASWARVGNDLRPYRNHQTFSHRLGGVNGFLAIDPVLSNTGIKPESTTSMELGSSAWMMDDRLGIDLTWYHTITSDQLLTIELPIGAGAESKYVNGGKVRNRGIELVLSTRLLRHKDIDWEMMINFGRNRNRVIEMHEEQAEITLLNDFLGRFVLEEGQPMGQIYSRGFSRDIVGRVLIRPHGHPDVRQQGLPLITRAPTVPVANLSPDWLGGMQHSFRYKNLSLGFLIDIRKGGTLISGTNMYLAQRGLSQQTVEGRDGGLIFGQNLFPDEQAVIKGEGGLNDMETDAETFYGTIGSWNVPVGEAWVVSATNARLREAVVSYEVPFSSDHLLQSINISLVGRNLFFLFNKAETIDPERIAGTEMTAEGWEAFPTPTPRSVGLKIQAVF